MDTEVRPKVDILLVSDIQARTWLARPENAAVKPLFVWNTVHDFTYLNKKWASAVPAIAASYRKLRR